ncbi:YlxR family protein [Butyrivibrio fibrisolvens]|uniref:RNase P modulator RnpM n=1 Tax=Pseudobutyrivibrio ruminis TaxID=46206 RepID=UPI00041B77E5|nr:YlxR family protein [Pseudobutyrivibrio ruminis]MDC7279719.1 YlxR family protein [Butyrivibrio fibrisolvens]
MTGKVLPLRKCVACGQMIPKDQLFRVVKIDGQAQLDLSYKAQGRGAYVCKKNECVALAEKKKSFNRALRGLVSGEVINSIKMELENGSR